MHYVTDKLSPLPESRASDAAENDCKLTVYADHTRARLSVEFFEDNRMKTVLHPLYSPNIAPSDFFLVGDVKRCLAGSSFVDAEDLFEAVRGVVASIESVTFQAGFLEWVDRLRECIQTNGEPTE
jgi:hypothetical protein